MPPGVMISTNVLFINRGKISNAAAVGVDAENSLQAGMVISVETTMQHPQRGFIKLEDTVAVTADGFELFGAEGRGWNRS